MENILLCSPLAPPVGDIETIRLPAYATAYVHAYVPAYPKGLFPASLATHLGTQV